MIPQGLAWQYLRQEALSTVPENISLNPKEATSLSRWQNRGFYRVVNASTRGFELEVPSTDFGSALFADCEHLLDAATEHQITIWRNVNNQEWLSPAWLSVTFYYWAFFLVLALTRLIGRSTWFINPDTARNFASLAPSPSKSPGHGCYRLEVGPIISATDRILSLHKRKSRMHDEVWHNWAHLCTTQLIPRSSVTSSSLENRLYSAITRANNSLGEEWPSSFRNAVNYRQAFAYSAIRKVKVLGTYSYLRTPITYDFEAILERLEQGVSRAHRTDIANNPTEIAKLLVDYTFILHSLVTELHSDIVERRNIDVRWKNARVRFRKENGVVSGTNIWPT